MKKRSKISLIGALAAISVPTIITTISCGQTEKYNISVSDKRVVLSTYKAEEGKEVNIKLKTVDSDKCQLTGISDVSVSGRSIGEKYVFEPEQQGSEWTHHLTISNEVVIDGPIEITAVVTVNQFSVFVNNEIDFEADSTQCYHDTTILLGLKSDVEEQYIDKVKSVTIKGQPLSPDYYEFNPCEHEKYTHSLTIKEDADHPHIISGDITIDLDIQSIYCDVSCSDNVIISKERATKGQPLSIMLNAVNEEEVIDSIEEVTIGGKTVEKEKIQLEPTPVTEVLFTHKLTINDPTLITGNVFIKMKTKETPYFSITMKSANIEISTKKAFENKQLVLFMWPKNGYELKGNIWINVDGSKLDDGYTFEKYVGQDFPDGTYVLTVDAKKITGNIDILVTAEKSYSLLSFDNEQMPERVDATLARTYIRHGSDPKKETVGISITNPKDWEFKNDGIIDIMLGDQKIEDAAKITANDTPGEYTISFIKIFEILRDIKFCIGEEIQTTKITYEQKIFKQDTEITDESECAVDGGALKEGYWHGDRIEADITTTTDYPTTYNYLFNEFEVTLVSKSGDDYDQPLKRSEDYEVSIDPNDAKKAHIIIFEGSINEPSGWTSKIDKIVFKYTMLDTIEKFSFVVTNGITTNTYLLPVGTTFEHTFDQTDIVDETKKIKEIEVRRKDANGNWELLTEGDYKFDSGVIEITSEEITGDIKVQLKLCAPEDITFENDTWEHIAYWASASDADFLANTYNLKSKKDLLNLKRSVTYGGIKQEVRVIGVNHDDLKYAEEGAMSGTKGETAALTFEFAQLLKDSSGAVKLDIGEEETNGQNYWRYNDGLKSKGAWGHQSHIRDYLQNKFAKNFDPDVKPWVKTISKRRLANAKIGMSRKDPVEETKFMVFNDQYFIASMTELNGVQGKEGSLTKNYIREGTVYEAYDDGSGGYDYAWEPRAKKHNGSYKDYWTCSFSIKYTATFQSFYDCVEYVYGSKEGYGNPMWKTIDNSMCIAPCFCI